MEITIFPFSGALSSKVVIGYGIRSFAPQLPPRILSCKRPLSCPVCAPLVLEISFDGSLLSLPLSASFAGRNVRGAITKPWTPAPRRGKAVMVGVDAVQELERLGVAVKAQVRTSLVELSSGSRTCVEVTVRRSAQFVESIAEATATAASASLPPAVSNVSNVDPSGTTNQGDVPAVEAPHGQER